MRPGLLRDDLLPLAGLLPPLAWLALQDEWLLPRLALCLAVVVGWQLLFARLRQQPAGLHGLAPAALIALLVPESAPFWQLVLGASFGMVLGEAIFGGRGRNFVQPVVLALAFMAFSFTDQPWRTGPDLPLPLALPSLALLLLGGQARLSVLAGLALGGFGIAALIEPGGIAALATGAVLLGALYLAADPVVSGATPLSRPIYGLLAGGLIALFAAGAEPFGALIFATLLAQVFAPLLDHIGQAIHVTWWRRRAARLRQEHRPHA